MQYREQNDKVQILAYRGYNKEKRRSEVKMLGSFDKYSFKMTDGLLEAMTFEEQKEFSEKLNEMRKSGEKTSRQNKVDSLVSRIVEVDDCLKNHGLTFDVSKTTDDQAAAVYSVIKALTKAMEEFGSGAPKSPAVQTLLW